MNQYPKNNEIKMLHRNSKGINNDRYRKKLTKELEKILKKKINEHRETAQKILEYFKCYNCGKCCEIPVVIHKKEASLISKVMGMAQSDFSIYIDGVNEFRVMYPCQFRERVNKRCHIYNFRPLVCRLFPFDVNVPVLQSIGICKMADDIFKFIEERRAEIALLSNYFIDHKTDKKIVELVIKLGLIEDSEIKYIKLIDKVSDFLEKSIKQKIPEIECRLAALDLETEKAMLRLLEEKR